jgi:cysteine desulfurase
VEIPVDNQCRITSAGFGAVLASQPGLISVMLANNETGAVQDVAALADAARPTRAWFHTDAVQALGKLPVNFRELNGAGVHAMTLSAHKIGGPKGAGALVADKRMELQPQIAGGGHERGLRSGTENVAAIVGFGVACELAMTDLEARAARQRDLRDALEQGLAAMNATIFAADARRLPNTSYFTLPDLDGETLVGKLDRAGFAVASGAACSSANPEPSHVLLAMGVDAALARGAVRVSLGPDSSAADVRGFLAALGETINQLGRMSALTH